MATALNHYAARWWVSALEHVGLASVPQPSGEGTQSQGATLASYDDELAEAVTRLLGSRGGWSLQPSPTPGTPPAWCFGSGGEIDLSVVVDRGTIDVYRMEDDRDLRFATVEDLTDWLDANEAASLEGPLQAGEIVKELAHGDFVKWGAEEE